MYQRGFSERDAYIIFHFGRCIELEDGRFLFTILPSPFSTLDLSGDLERLTDCSVVLSADGEVVTVYHNDERCPLYRMFALAE